jgi:hypothetical protein
MRVFYTEEPNIIARRYHVTVENITIPESLKGTIAFDAETTTELKTKIIAHYGFNLPATIELQLWSAPHGSSGTRLDLESVIPESYNNVWIRAAEVHPN